MSSGSSYPFDEQVWMSDGHSDRADVRSILVRNVAGAVNAVRAGASDDRAGTDWWMIMSNGHRLSVDCKIRAKDFATFGKDDLALETWSVAEKQIVGWTRRRDKRTDYVLWLWADTGRWCLISFPMLCTVFSEKWRDWTKAYGPHRQYTPGEQGGYHSECVFVPRAEVHRAIYRRFGGGPAASVAS